MPLITPVAPELATGLAAETYAKAQAAFGFVPEGLQLLAVSPRLAADHFTFIEHYLHHTALGGPLQACIRLLVSQANRCDYCIDRNSAMLLNRFGWSPEQLAATRTDPGSAPLPAREVELLQFVLDAVRGEVRTDAARLDLLRAGQWSDADILDALMEGARMAAIDVIFNTFGVTD